MNRHMEDLSGGGLNSMEWIKVEGRGEGKGRKMFCDPWELLTGTWFYQRDSLCSPQSMLVKGQTAPIDYIIMT